MSAFPDLDLLSVSRDLERLHRICTDRRLIDTSKWSAEFLWCLPEMDIGLVVEHQSEEGGVQWRRSVAFTHACMDCQEFRRATQLSAPFVSSSPLLAFLHYFSRYLGDEKRRLDNSVDVLDSGQEQSQELTALYQDLRKANEEKPLEPYLAYLFGIVLRSLKHRSEAEEALVASLNGDPVFWPAWLELSKLISAKNDLVRLKLPEHWMKQLFLAEVYNRLQMPDEALAIYESLRNFGIKDFPYISGRIALAKHILQEMDEAAQIFKDIHKKHPYRLEHMDTYSNSLFVLGNRVELAALAHDCFHIEKYCAITCSVLGNYYGLRGEHEKAVESFQRAVRLEPWSGDSWTLMGHEFMELKNTSAASLAYRRALEVDSNDHRAWFALGNIYDLLKMPSYALYYFNRAHRAKPQDSRFLVAIGDMLTNRHEYGPAAKAYWRAHCVGDIEGQVLFKLGKALELEKNPTRKKQVAACYWKYLRALQQNGERDEECEARAYKFLMEHAMDSKQYDACIAYCHCAMEYDETKGIGKHFMEKASALKLKEIKQEEDNDADMQFD